MFIVSLNQPRNILAAVSWAHDVGGLRDSPVMSPGGLFVVSFWSSGSLLVFVIAILVVMVVLLVVVVMVLAGRIRTPEYGIPLELFRTLQSTST